MLDGLDMYQGSLYQELERVILRQYQVSVQRADWQADTLPPHLKMRFVLLDDSGQMLAQSRSLTDLLHQCHDTASVPEHKAPSLPETRVVTSSGLDSIDQVITLRNAPGKPELLAYASLQVDQTGSKVELHYVTNKEESRIQIRSGLRQLITLDLAKDSAGLRKQCKDVVSSQSASWLSLGAGVSAAELQRQLFAFTLDAVFALDMEVIPSQTQYDAAMAAVRCEGLLRQARSVLERVVQLVRQRRELVGVIQQWAGRARQARNYDAGRHQEYQNALERIVPSNFLEELSADSLRERLRYLQGLAMRIERAEHDPKKDALKAERLQGPERRLQEATRFLRQAGHSSQCRACLREYSVMLEEFRISVFAPELGTKQPVSEKRLRQKWAEVENICRRVE